MNILNIFEEIEKVDPEFNERISPRRAAIRNMAGFGKKAALSALPLALGSLFQKAYGQTAPADVNAVLNFALTLEYLESEFYTIGVATPGLIPAGSALAALTLIRNDENNHVAFLKSVLMANAVAKPTFDFTAKGNFNPFGDYDVFLALAQAFEDTGVRAYKGQAPNLLGNKTVLGAALNIHSVEARHASHLRMMRRARTAASQKPWITGNDIGGLPAAAQPIYNGEELDTQATVKITGISANGVTISANAATEAFDEPLSSQEVLAIATLFIAG